VGVFDAEARELHLGVAVGHVVPIGVGVEQQVRRVGDPDAACADSHRRGDVQSRQYILTAFVAAVAIPVLEHRDDVVATYALGRGQWHAVEARTQVVVVLDDADAGGELVLAILHHPEAPARVPRHEERLLDVGLGRHEFDAQAFAQAESGQRVGG
jgi:hypothetical protein